jgi:hypothetical protein
VTYCLHLRGEAVELAPGRFWAETRATLDGLTEVLGDGEAVCRRELELLAGGSFVQRGEVSFGGGSALTFRAVGGLADSPGPGLRHGAAVCEVTGGRGLLAGARGSIASTFLLADAGELTDHHLGLLFVEQPRKEGLT